jgi:hypothetical protein
MRILSWLFEEPALKQTPSMKQRVQRFESDEVARRTTEVGAAESSKPAQRTRKHTAST